MNELLVKRLNEQLVSEYEGVFSYLYHSSKVKDDEIRKAMADFSRDELEHARMLINYIISLGGEPVFMMPKVNREQDEVQVLIFSIAAEESAVKMYTMIQQIIDDAEGKEIIGRTIRLEEAHHRELNEILNKVKEFYKGKRGAKQTHNIRYGR